MKVSSITNLFSNGLKNVSKKAKTAVVATSIAATPAAVTSCAPAAYMTHGVPYGTVVTHTVPTVVTGPTIITGTTYYNPAWSYGYWLGRLSVPHPAPHPAPPPKPAPHGGHHR